ncbi:MAG TPA: rod shape-determining protein RodA [Firmicutes bacterium]|jgi:rod shape determining protein RodA|nr:rod shape-determining protein RodA [Bacillota bacterium]
MFDRRLLKNFDYQLLLIVLALCLYGLLVLSSAIRGAATGSPLVYLQKQALSIGIGILAILIIISIDYIYLYRLSWYFYALNFICLGAVLFIGSEGGGSYRWIDLKVIDFQPSELAKIIIIITLASLLVGLKEKLANPVQLLPLFLHVLVPMVLIFLQPDLGTALVFAVIFIGMLYMAGVPVKNLLILVGSGIAVTPLFWLKLMNYQKMRLIVFVNPDMDPLHYGYQLTQSMIAIGSGGLTGKGLFSGTQARLQFLPEQHTDFIFSVLGEELGFLGSAILLLLYFLLIYRILKIASFSKDSFGFLLCAGVATMLTFQILVNVGMTLSIMPVTGLPLPFMSYGGNAMLMNMISIGVVLNVGMRRHKIQF